MAFALNFVRIQVTLARFESILKALTLTKETAPPYKDSFWEVREMLQSWNELMQKVRPILGKLP